MSTTTLTLSDVTGYIATEATETDLDQIITMLNARRKVLDAQRASALTVGAKVTLDGLSPKYLNGLTGVVKNISGTRATVTLDTRSTELLRYSGRRFFVPADITEHDMNGVPAQCCVVVN